MTVTKYQVMYQQFKKLWFDLASAMGIYALLSLKSDRGINKTEYFQKGIFCLKYKWVIPFLALASMCLGACTGVCIRSAWLLAALRALDDCFSIGCKGRNISENYSLKKIFLFPFSINLPNCCQNVVIFKDKQSSSVTTYIKQTSFWQTR